MNTNIKKGNIVFVRDEFNTKHSGVIESVHDDFFTVKPDIDLVIFEISFPSRESKIGDSLIKWDFDAISLNGINEKGHKAFFSEMECDKEIKELKKIADEEWALGCRLQYAYIDRGAISKYGMIKIIDLLS